MTAPEEDALLDAFNTSFAAIDLLIDRGMIQPALVQLYSTIDAAAWLAVTGDGDVTKTAFTQWCSAYLLPNSQLECSALELYGARCGVLHSFTAISKLSRDGTIRTISYAFGVATLQQLKRVARELDHSGYVGVHLDDLRLALREGMQRFLNDAAADRIRWQNIRDRAKKLFSLLPHDGENGIFVVIKRSKGA